MQKVILVLLSIIALKLNAMTLSTGIAYNSSLDSNASSAVDLAASTGSFGALAVADSASAAYDSTPSGSSSLISPSAINSFAGTLSELSISGGSLSSAAPSAALNVSLGPTRISALTASSGSDTLSSATPSFIPSDSLGGLPLIGSFLGFLYSLFYKQPLQQPPTQQPLVVQQPQQPQFIVPDYNNIFF